jgi:murein DD-endopeptidase MepM/ murein hydrolase activator NlpD
LAFPRSALCAALATGLAAAAAPAVVVGDEASNTGGSSAPAVPDVRSVKCEPTPGVPCPSGGALRRGGQVAIKGDALDAASRVVFLGRRGKRDNVSVRPTEVDHVKVVATVARRARSGRVMVISRGGRRAASPARVRVTGHRPGTGEETASSGDFFFDGLSRPRFSFEVDRPGAVRVDLVRSDDSSVVQSWDVDAVPGRPNTVEWEPGGQAPRNGRYVFRISGATAGARATGTEEFDFYDHIFPVRGRHDLGQTNTNGFGGGRGHKGQDMFARCGTKLVAARGGTVEAAEYHAAAGNYLVIDGAGTGVDYVYMHLLEPAPVRKGERVRTGQAIGQVGESGRATGCHLHFEMWSAPGWYAGGEAFDPLPQLRAWDEYS